MKTILVMSALALGMALAVPNLSTAGDTPKPDVRATTTGAVVVPPSPPKHAYYECSSGTCKCVNARDCGTMGADHVCQEGTFVGNTCTEKKY